MKHKRTASVALLVPSSPLCLAQASQPADANDWKPSFLNQPGKQYPQVTSDGWVRTSISAAQAQSQQGSKALARVVALQVRQTGSLPDFLPLPGLNLPPKSFCPIGGHPGALGITHRHLRAGFFILKTADPHGGRRLSGYGGALLNQTARAGKTTGTVSKLLWPSPAVTRCTPTVMVRLVVCGSGMASTSNRSRLW